MFEIFGKVALVTGGASGIGLSTVEHLLENGVKGVTIADVDQENGRKVADKFNEKYGSGKVLFLKVNVANRTEFEDAFKATVKNFQHLDILVNVAGIVKDLKWEEEIAVNLGGTVAGTYFGFEEYLPKYKSGSEGVIVNISSITALQAFAYAPVYSATKAGVVMFTRCYGSPVHYDRKQVRVMALCPGYTNTPLQRIHPDRLLGPTFYDLKEVEIVGQVFQQPEHVAKAIISMIRGGDNGSIWVVENCQDPYEMKFIPKEECKK